MDEDPPKAELTPEEKKMSFRKCPVPDLTQYALNTSFMKFTLPEIEEGFDEIRFEWLKGEKCKEYMKQWMLERKMTTRVEELVPGEWFATKFKEWQKILQSWHSKQNIHKAAVARKASDKAAKVAAKAVKEARAKAKAKAAAKAAAAKKAADEKVAAEKA